MGASFRNADEIIELAGCDLLTISPQFLQELENMTGTVDRKLDPENAKKMSIEKLNIDQKAFLWKLNENEMASTKLYEGIRKFAEDAQKLEKKLVEEYKLS